MPQSETEYSTGESGTIYLGLAGKDSYLHGVMGYRADQGYDDYEESGTNYYSGDVRLLMKMGHPGPMKPMHPIRERKNGHPGPGVKWPIWNPMAV